MKLSDLHWFAGFYEGEGSVCCYRQNGGFFSLAITQKDTEPIERCQRIFGGKIYYVGHYSEKRKYSQWMIYGRAAVGLAMTMYGLLTKRRQDQLRKSLGIWRSVPTHSMVLKTRKRDARGRLLPNESATCQPL